MSLVSIASNKDAHFRWLKSFLKHSSADCIKNAIIFDITKYDETKFDIVKALQ